MVKKLKKFNNMKIKFYVMVFCFSLLMLIGCDGIIEPILPAPSVELRVSKETAKYGDTITITWISLRSTYCTINGVKVDCSGSMDEKLIGSKTYTIVAYGTESTAKDEKLVVVETPAPTVTINAPSAPIRFGDKAKFSWAIDGPTTSITLDGKPIEKIGEFESPELLINTEYTLIATGPGGTKTEVIKIAVGDWMNSTFGLLIGSWKMIQEDVLKENEDLYWSEFEKDLVPYIITISTDHIFKDTNNGKPFGQYVWSLVDNEKTLLRGTARLSLRKITVDTLITVSPSQFFHDDGSVEKTFLKRYYKKIAGYTAN